MAKLAPYKIYRTEKDGNKVFLGTAMNETECIQKIRALEDQFNDYDSYWGINVRTGAMVDTTGIIRTTVAGQLGVL